MEMPDVWIMDVVKAGQRIDELFIEIVEPDTVCAIGAHCWVMDGFAMSSDPNANVLVAGIRKGFREKRFELMTEKQFEENNRFWAQQYEGAGS